MNGILGELVGALGIIAAAVMGAWVAAGRGIKAYREQKEVDQKNALIKRRQTEYEKYITSFTKAGRLKSAGDAVRGAEAETEYHQAHDNLLLVGSEEVVSVANDFHRYYVNTHPPDPKQVKLRFADVIIAMRQEVFERTKLDRVEVAKSIPWTIGDEDERPIDWTENPELDT